MENVDQSPVKVRHPWQFQPGGRPGPGRPRKTDAQRAAEIVTRQAAEAAIERLLGKAVLVVEKALKAKDPAIGLRAAFDVLDRSLGKPTQRIEGNITGEPVIQATPEMLRLAAQRLLAASAVDVESKEVER